MLWPKMHIMKFLRSVQNVVILNCLINVIPSLCAVTAFNCVQKAFPFWKFIAYLSCYLNAHSCSRSHCKLLMLHTFEYCISGEWDKISKNGKKQRAWYALWAAFWVYAETVCKAVVIIILRHNYHQIWQKSVKIWAFKVSIWIATSVRHISSHLVIVYCFSRVGQTQEGDRWGFVYTLG